MSKLKTLFAFAIINIALSFTVQANAQTPQRIQFAKGKNSATLSGLTGRYGANYILRAKSGQKIVLNLKSAAKVGVKVETVGRFGEMVLLQEDSVGIYEIGLEETGEYTILIGSGSHKPVRFTLTVTIVKLADV